MKNFLSGGHLDVLKVLLEDQDEKNMLWKELNQTLLHLAASDGHLDIVKYLFGFVPFVTDINPSSAIGKVLSHYCPVHLPGQSIFCLGKNQNCPGKKVL